MTRLHVSQLLTYPEVAKALDGSTIPMIAQLVALGLLEGHATPFGLTVTRSSVEWLCRRRQAGQPDPLGEPLRPRGTDRTRVPRRSLAGTG